MAEPEQEQPPPSAAEQAVIAALAILLASAGSMAPAAILLALLRILRPFGIDRAPAWTAFKIVRSVPRPRIWRSFGVRPGPAARAARAQEATYRAAYLLNASRRLQAAVAAGEDLGAALNRERAYATAHQRAAQNRAQVASDVDDSSRLWGPVLGWYTVLDDRTSKDCRRANGKNFLAAVPPRIGWPGSVHPHCRCRPGPPHATRVSVDGGTLRPPATAPRARVPA